jgi:very-short-patch-repair endonuclease
MWHKLQPRAGAMRKKPTEAEARLWHALRRNQVLGLRFRRQHAIDFFVDFFCPEARTIVEVDGPIHDDQQEADTVRQRHLEGLGYKVFRVRNEEVMGDLAATVTKIAEMLRARLEKVKQ